MEPITAYISFICLWIGNQTLNLSIGQIPINWCIFVQKKCSHTEFSGGTERQKHPFSLAKLACFCFFHNHYIVNPPSTNLLYKQKLYL